MEAFSSILCTVLSFHMYPLRLPLVVARRSLKENKSAPSPPRHKNHTRAAPCDERCRLRQPFFIWINRISPRTGVACGPPRFRALFYSSNVRLKKRACIDGTCHALLLAPSFVV